MAPSSRSMHESWGSMARPGLRCRGESTIRASLGQRCLYPRASPAEFSIVDQMFRNRGVSGVNEESHRDDGSSCTIPRISITTLSAACLSHQASQWIPDGVKRKSHVKSKRFHLFKMVKRFLPGSSQKPPSSYMLSHHTWSPRTPLILWSMLLRTACRHPKRNGCFRRPFQAKRCNNIEFGERGHASSFAMSVTGGLFFLEPGMSPFVRWIQPRKLWKKILCLRNNKGTQENTKHKSNPQVCEVRLNRMLNTSSGKVLKRPPQSYGRGAPLQHVALSNGPVRPLVCAQ